MRGIAGWVRRKVSQWRCDHLYRLSEDGGRMFLRCTLCQRRSTGFVVVKRSV